MLCILSQKLCICPRMHYGRQRKPMNSHQGSRRVHLMFVWLNTRPCMTFQLGLEVMGAPKRASF